MGPAHLAGTPPPECIACYYSEKKCARGTIGGCCIECHGTTPGLRRCAGLDGGIPDFLTAHLIAATDPRPAALHFPVCASPDCWQETTIWLNETGRALRISIPPEPVHKLPPDKERALDDEVRKLSPDCFRYSHSPAFFVQRYLSILCPTAFDTPRDPVGRAKAFTLGCILLPRIADLLTSSMELIIRWSYGIVPQADGLRELAVLYSSIVGIHDALDRRKASTSFRRALLDSLHGWTRALRPYVQKTCATYERWADVIGINHVDSLMFDRWATKIHLVFQPCPHSPVPTSSRRRSSAMGRSLSTRTNGVVTSRSWAAAEAAYQTLPVAVDDPPGHQQALLHTTGSGTWREPPRDGTGETLGDDVPLPTIAEVTVPLDALGLDAARLLGPHLAGWPALPPAAATAPAPSWRVPVPVPESPREAYVRACLTHAQTLPQTLQDKAEAAERDIAGENRPTIRAPPSGPSSHSGHSRRRRPAGFSPSWWEPPPPTF